MPSQPLHNVQQQLSVHSNHKGRENTNASTSINSMKNTNARVTSSSNMPPSVVGSGQNANRQLPGLPNSDPHHRITPRPTIGLLATSGHSMSGIQKIPMKVDHRMPQKDLRGPTELATKATGNTSNPNMYGNTSSNKMYPTSLPQYNANTNHTPAFASNNTALNMNPKVECTNDAIRNAMQGNRNYGNTVSNLGLFKKKLVLFTSTFITIYSNHRDSHNVVIQ